MEPFLFLFFFILLFLNSHVEVLFLILLPIVFSLAFDWRRVIMPHLLGIGATLLGLMAAFGNLDREPFIVAAISFLSSILLTLPLIFSSLFFRTNAWVISLRKKVSFSTPSALFSFILLSYVLFFSFFFHAAAFFGPSSDLNRYGISSEMDLSGNAFTSKTTTSKSARIEGTQSLFREFTKRVFLASLFSAGESTSRKEVFRDFFAPLGAKGMLDALEQAFPYCHGQAHELGTVLFEETSDLPLSINLCQNRCSTGCFHGVVIGALKAKGRGDEISQEKHVSLEDLREKMKAICADPPAFAYNYPGNCSHALGHAVMILADYIIKDATRYCALLPDPRLEYYCVSGAYMEYEMNFGSSDRATQSRFYPCEGAAYPAACLRYKMSFLVPADKTPEAIGAIAKECTNLPYAEHLGCFHGIGHAVVDDVLADPSRLSAFCTFGTEDDKKVCIEGAVESVAFYDPDAASRSCDFVSDGLRNFCKDASLRRAFSLEKNFDLYLIR